MRESMKKEKNDIFMRPSSERKYVFLTSFWDIVWIYGRNVNTSRTPHTAAEAFLYVKISRYAYSKMKDPLLAYFAYIKYSSMPYTEFL